MPKGSNKLVINAEGYAPLFIDFDDYKIDFQSMGTYVMVVIKPDELSEEQKRQIYLEYTKTHDLNVSEEGDIGTDISHAKTAYDFIVIGYRYEIGIGTEKNYEEAVKWYRLAAEQKNYDAKEALEELGMGE